MALKPTQQLIRYGQSLWYDNISRDMLDNGELKRLIEEFGVRGMTSNPSIFDAAISKSAVYDKTIGSHRSLSVAQIFEELALEDIARAADLLRPIYDESGGEDGFVSIEVSPLLASDTQGTLIEAKRLSSRLNRPNIMIKVPGTPEGIPAVQALLEEGISVNITLLFGVKNYEEVARTYCTALRNRVKRGGDVRSIRSVASFFVSRVDSAIDKRLGEIIEQSKMSDTTKAEKAQSLLGQFGIANSKVAYDSFRKIFLSNEFDDLRKVGAAVQRPLWASTSTKNPKYRDVMYVENLIGAHTVNTMPHDTVLAFADHGEVRESIGENVVQALKMQAELESVGVDVEKIIADLQTDGVKKFADSFAALSKSIETKLKQVG